MKVFDLKNFDKLDFFGISKKKTISIESACVFTRKICVNFFCADFCWLIMCSFMYFTLTKRWKPILQTFYYRSIIKWECQKKNSNAWNPYLGVFYTIANCTRTLTILHCSKSYSIWTKNRKKNQENFWIKYCFYYTPSSTTKTWISLGVSVFFLKSF